MSWLDRLRGGFSKTAERVADNLTGLTSRAALDTATLDDVEEALIASDLGPEASHRIREAIARQKFERLDERGLRTILAEEIEKILTPVAKPLEVWGFPRPHVILVIGVNGSGKTTTIGKLGHWLKEQDYGVLFNEETLRVQALVIRRGHFFSHEVVLPARYIVEVVEVLWGIVRVEISDDELRALLPYESPESPTELSAR